MHSNECSVAHLTNVLTHSSGDFNNRRKEIDYPSRGVDLNPTNHVPETTDTNYGTKTDDKDVLIMNTKNDERPTSFFAQPGILAGEYLLRGGWISFGWTLTWLCHQNRS
jgi:hypothetical protein